MRTLEQQIADYADYQDELHGPITVTELMEPATVMNAGRLRTQGWVVAVAVAAAVLLLGLASLLLLDIETPTDPAVDTPPATPTTLVEATPATLTTKEELTPLDGFVNGNWTYVEGTASQAYRVITLPQGAYAAVPLWEREEGVEYWHSSDGLDWEPWTDVDPIFLGNAVEWVVGDWAATWPAEGQTSPETVMTLWHYADNDWTVVAMSEDVQRWNQPSFDGDVALIPGLGKSEQFVWRADSGQAGLETLPWLVTPNNSEGMSLHDVDILALPNGGFAAYVKSYDRPGEDEFGWLQPPVNTWLSPDGLVWESFGAAPFTTQEAIGADIYRLGDRLVAVNAQGSADSFAYSFDGLAWEEGTGLNLPTDDTMEPDQLVTTSEGYLLYSGPFLMSTDNGQTWLQIPDYEDVNVESTGYFSIHGIAGDLIYHSQEDGLWIGRPSP